MDPEPYLAPGFDPNTLTVAKLRGILLKYEVDYPSSAKKSVLLDLFNTHIAPRAASLRAAAVAPSTFGMIDAGATPEKNEVGATPARRRTRARDDDDRRRTIQPADDDDLRTPRRRSDPAADDAPTPATVRKTRKSLARQLGAPEADTPPDTPFSSYNPFQAGSPPAAEPERRQSRRSIAPAQTPARRSLALAEPEPTPARRNQAPAPTPARRSLALVDPTPRRSMAPVDPTPRRRQSARTQIKAEPVDSDDSDDSDALAPGEEFVPEEAAPGGARGHARGFSLGRASGHALLAVITVVLAAYAAWWRAEKIEVGYCGVGGLDARRAPEPHVLVDLLRPECEPCPAHARCYPGLVLECADDYIRRDSVLALGGLWPIPPVCAPDSEKERRVMIMSDAALDILRRNGAEQRCKEKFLSGDLALDGVPDAELRQVLYDRKAVSPFPAREWSVWMCGLWRKGAD